MIQVDSVWISEWERHKLHQGCEVKGEEKLFPGEIPV